MLEATGSAILVAGAMMAATDSVWLALAAFVAIGGLSSIINVTVITAFQAAVPPTIRGRVMVMALSTAAVPIGMGLGGVCWGIAGAPHCNWCSLAVGWPSQS